MKDLITIDETKLEVLIDNSKLFANNREAQQWLIQLIQMEKIVKEAISEVKLGLKDALEERDLTFVEGDLVKVSAYKSGPKFKLVDPEIAPKEVLDVKLNAKKLNEYLKDNELPQGIEIKEQSTALRITVK